MDPWLGWLEGHREDILTVLSSGIVLAALGVVARLLRRLWDELHGRGRVVLIRRADDPLIRWIEDVQERIFPPDECDPRGVLGRRVEESDFSLFGRPRAEAAMIALVYRKGRTPVAYLSAQYFPKTGAIFFWYIVSLTGQRYRDKLADLPLRWSDIDAVDDGISSRLIDKLLTVCDRGPDWKYIVAEVDIDDLAEARGKVSTFQRFAGQLVMRRLKNPLARWRMRREKMNVTELTTERVFKVDIPFVMPLHDHDLLHRAADHESDGWLIFAPRTKAPYRAGRGYQISGEQVRSELLHSLIVLGYHNPGDDAYNAYVDAFYARLVADIPETVKLIANPRLME